MTDALKRWIAVASGGDTVRLLPVNAPSCGPDVFVKLADVQQLETENARLRKDNAEIQAQLSDAIPVLEFYGDPDTYFAIAFLNDAPSGEFMEDFTEVEPGRFKLGKRARELFAKYAPVKESER